MDESIRQINVCIRRLVMYSHQCDSITASTIRKILKIIIRYVTIKIHQGFNPINQDLLNVLDIYIRKIQNNIPADILFLTYAAVETIRDDREMTTIHHIISSVYIKQDQPEEIGVEECNKYENLRRESNNIRNRLNELELEPNVDAVYISNLGKRLSIIIKYTSEFEKKYGGGASKF